MTIQKVTDFISASIHTKLMRPEYSFSEILHALELLRDEIDMCIGAIQEDIKREELSEEEL